MKSILFLLFASLFVLCKIFCAIFHRTCVWAKAFIIIICAVAESLTDISLVVYSSVWKKDSLGGGVLGLLERFSIECRK